MKPFRFRAAALLHLRQQQRDLARATLSRAAAAARESEAEMARADARIAEAVDRYRQALGESPQVAAIERHQIWIANQKARASTSAQTHADRVGAVDAAGVVLKSAHRQVRMLERLRERMLAKHNDAVKRQELKEIDELATLRYAIRQIEGGLES